MHLRIKSPLSLLLVVWGICAFAPGVVAQCVKCDDCVLSIPCPRQGGCGDGSGVVVSDAKFAKGAVRCQGADTKGYEVDAATIRAVAQRHPRFARMLASLNSVGGVKSWARVSSFPAPLEASEVENWLKPPAETREFFQAYQKRRVPGAKLIVYEFTTEQVDGSHAVIRGEVVSGFAGDPAGKTLLMEVVDGKVANWKVY